MVIITLPFPRVDTACNCNLLAIGTSYVYHKYNVYLTREGYIHICQIGAF